MKKILSLLVAFIFLQTQTWALSGGPFGNASSNTLVGTYAGVMIGTIPAGGVGGIGGAGLGIFTVGLPEGGIGTGIFAVYSGGNSIGGDVIGIGNPEDFTIRGVMSGTFIPNVTVTGGVIFGGVVTTLGAQFDAQVQNSRRTAATTGARLTGNAGATITYYSNPINQVMTDFVLIGYKQSGDPMQATSVDLPGNFAGG